MPIHLNVVLFLRQTQYQYYLCYLKKIQQKKTQNQAYYLKYGKQYFVVTVFERYTWPMPRGYDDIKMEFKETGYNYR